MDSSDQNYGLRPGAEEFPLMVVISVIYPCNFGCPNCPYTDGNSELRKFYREAGAELLPVELWKKMADECGPYGAWMRCTGGGEPMLHPQMVQMVEYAKDRGARIWMNSNGSMFGPGKRQRENLRSILGAGIDLIEFSMDAGDADTYSIVRPLRSHAPRDPAERWKNQVDNIRAAIDFRRELRGSNRLVVSMIRQQAMDGKIEGASKFWLEEVGVDEVITRKFLSWDDNTSINLGKSIDRHLYADSPHERKEPCVWPFERLNVDTLGRIALCGQDISFRTEHMFPNLFDSSIKEIWQSETFNWYRKMHLEGRGAECWPCRGCSAWLAGIRDWEHGWLKVLKTSGYHVKEVMKQDLGVDVDVYQPGE